ncbi:MAG: glutamate--tRNA ligase [Bacteroidales bacterium]
MTNKKVRVRFAPSPTGPLHIGGVRTALYNYLFARKHGGNFLLRIEDTDQNRFVQGAEEYIMESLRWCGIHWDEGPGKDGPHAPYRQSERKELYRRYAIQLIENGHAYYAFDTAEELEAMRKRIEAEKGNAQYDATTRGSMKNSLTLNRVETVAMLESGAPYVVRFKMPANEEVVMQDQIRGTVKVNTSLLDDKVLFKSDGMPTYHLANVVDDYLMEISHVIRGEEWLPSLPLHVLLYRSLGWENSMPHFAHLPLLLKPDGNGKLSKRDGDRLGFPVFPLMWNDPNSGEISAGYRESGYFADAFVNMLALLGWNPGTDKEIFSMDELVEAFSLERVGKSGSKFDPAKAKWFNHQYLLRRDDKEVAALFDLILKDRGIHESMEKITKIVSMVKDRVSFVHEMWDQAIFFFIAPREYDEKMVKKKWKEDTPDILRQVTDVLRNLESFTVETIDKALHDYMEEHEVGAGKLMIALRLSLVGAGMGPDLKEIMVLLGKEETVARIEKAINIIGKG